MNKNGLSTIIATLMIILLTLVAFAIVVGVVVPFASESLEESTICKDYDDYYRFYSDFGLNCVDGENYKISVKASERANNHQVIGLAILFQDANGLLESVEIINGTTKNGVVMLGGEASLTIPTGGEVKSYVYTSDESRIYKEASLLSIIENKKYCAISDKIRIRGTC